MGNYLPHLNRKNRRAACATAIWTPSPENDAERRNRIAAEREGRRQLDERRRTRAAERHERRARDALQADAVRAEPRARLLFPWDQLGPERKVAAILAGQPRRSRFPILDLALLFAGANLGVPPSGIAKPAADFITQSAPRTRDWDALSRTADFFIAAHAARGRLFDRDELLAQAVHALANLDERLSALPDWLTVHRLDATWFNIRPVPETPNAIWDQVDRRQIAERGR
jgi:hypothetical protein